MLVAAALTVLLGGGPPDSKYMHVATYLVGSKAVDKDAPGGFYQATNFPEPIEGRTSGQVEAVLSAAPGGLRLLIKNGTHHDVWFRAADSNLMGALQAKDSKGKWRAIEYKPWYSCGNSYHRVQLPAGSYWNLGTPLGMGSFKTKVRWIGPQEPALVSNELNIGIAPEKFELPPELRKDQELRGEVVPTLMPKDAGK